MRLLFDQNISSKIIRNLSDTYPGCSQVILEGLSNASDLDIWQWAKKNNCCIVTFDSDFLDIATLKGFPPKVILLRIGNRRTNDLAEVLTRKKDVIINFLLDTNISCLEIFS